MLFFVLTIAKVIRQAFQRGASFEFEDSFVVLSQYVQDFRYNG